MDNERRIEAAINNAIGDRIPDECPRRKNPIGTTEPYPVIDVAVSGDFLDGLIAAEDVLVRCDQCDPGSSVCEKCELKKGLVLNLQQHFN